jgi:hypothetical protein
LRTLNLLRWVDDSMPGIAWENDTEHPPAIHPDDLAAAKQMSAQLAIDGRVSRALRFRGTSGE